MRLASSQRVQRDVEKREHRHVNSAGRSTRADMRGIQRQEPRAGDVIRDLLRIRRRRDRILAADDHQRRRDDALGGGVEIGIQQSTAQQPM